MKTLASLLQTLPQELYDAIYDLTFTTGFGEYYIDSDYEPPSCLQVSKSTRESFAQSYYGNGSIFYVETQRDTIWKNSLTKAHASLITDIRIKAPRLMVSSKQRRLVQLAIIRETYWTIYLPVEVYHKLSESLFGLKFNIGFESGEDAVWMSFTDAEKTL